MIPKTIRSFQGLIIGLITLVIIYPLIVVINYYLIFNNKIYPRVKVLGINLAGLTKDKGLILLEDKIKKEDLKTLLIEYQDKTWLINLADFDFQYQPHRTIERAWQFGRDKDFNRDLLAKWEAWQKGADFNLDFKLNQDLLREKTATITAFIDRPVIPPTIEIKAFPLKEIEVKTGRPGKEVNQEKLFQLISDNLSQIKKEKIILPVEEISPSITLEQAEKTKLRAQNFLDKKIRLSFKQNQWELEDKELINFLKFDDGFDRKKIASYSSQLAQSINRPPQNALFNFTGGKVIEFKPAQEGQELDQEQTSALLLEALEGLEKEENKIALVNLPITFNQPQIATQDVNDLGIKDIIGQGESWFYGSITSRIHNIKLASQKLNGLLIAPGETFSFNKALGDVSPQTGFQQAYIIKEGRTVLGDGGGVCQVSTTLFRAALDAGLPIEERKAHAYRVSYYEQNYQAGVDATVFDPTADLKFKNDTPSHILIQALTDTQNLKLTFWLYGTPDGRTVTISSSRIWDQTPPPPDLYQDDPTLPIGVIKQIDWKAWGAKVAFDWKVTKGNEILQERTFYSSYRPWQAVFLKGTGG